MREKWLPVIESNGFYEVSDFGRLRRSKPSPHTKMNYILKPVLRHDGYTFFTLHNGGHRIQRQAHRLVCEAFLGAKPTGYDVNHKNGNRADNRIENLEYVTRRENINHARWVLGSFIGEKHPRAVFTNEQVRKIKKLLPKHSDPSIAKMFKTIRQNINCIRRKKTWTHIN